MQKLQRLSVIRDEMRDPQSDREVKSNDVVSVCVSHAVNKIDIYGQGGREDQEKTNNRRIVGNFYFYILRLDHFNWGQE